MTEQDWIELGKRAVACDGWRWIPGVRGWWRTDRDAHNMHPRIDSNSLGYWASKPSATVDLRDPATIGCLTHLVREVWGEPDASASVYHFSAHRHAWGVTTHRWAAFDGEMVERTLAEFEHKTEAEALVSALEAAPTR
jgi:hypothetical protein